MCNFTDCMKDTLQRIDLQHTPLPSTDILLGPLEAIPELQNSVSQLCEGWWCTEREEREGLVPHTLLYIVARSLTDGALVQSIVCLPYMYITYVQYL